MQADTLTDTIGKMGFARVLIEVNVNSTLPDLVPITLEHGVDSVTVTYEWYPAQ